MWFMVLTMREARRRLQEWNIAVGPLKARPHEETVVTIPAPSLSRGTSTDLDGEPLRQILISAREEGEKALFYFGHSEEQLRAAASSAGNSTPPEVAVLLDDERTAVGAAWDELIKKVAQALRKENLTTQIGPLLENFYHNINESNARVAAQCARQMAEIQIAESKTQTQEVQAAADSESQAPKRKRGRPRKDQEDTHAGKYPVHTSQEWLALLHTASDGHYQRHFTSDENRGVLRHQRPNAPFFTETMLSDEERRASFGLELLRQAAEVLDLDDGFIWLYVSDLIAPTQPLAKGNYAGGWVDLDDVARRTLGGYAPNPAEAQRRRRKVWHAIRYGARAIVGGERSIPYFDKTSGKTIDTQIHTTPWQIVSRQQSVQPSLFPDDEEAVPVRVELVASREWTALTTASDTAQFLPMGEMLGSIPPNQSSGAWARSLGLAYFHWCRVHLHTALNDEASPSRQELLKQFPSKTSNYEAILNSSNPSRALNYWRGAEDYLREAGFIITTTTSESTTRQNWKELWLAQSSDWKPGAQLRPLLQALAANLFQPAPRALRKTKARSKTKKSATKTDDENQN